MVYAQTPSAITLLALGSQFETVKSWPWVAGDGSVFLVGVVPGHSGQSGRSAQAGQIQQASHSRHRQQRWLDPLQLVHG